MNQCLFCQFTNDLSKVNVVDQNDNYFVITDKFPKAPIHLLVIPKKHISKTKPQSKTDQTNFYSKIISYVHQIAKKQNLQNGYEVKSFYNGYNHFDHEHIHILSGHK